MLWIQGLSFNDNRQFLKLKENSCNGGFGFIEIDNGLFRGDAHEAGYKIAFVL